MVTVNIHEAKTQLSKLVDRAAKGEPFVIAKAGKPLVKVTPVDAPAEPRRLGFLAGEIAVPEEGYLELKVSSQHAVSIDTLPPLHKDPFDRLLLAQAMVEGITLLTADAQLARYGPPARKV